MSLLLFSSCSILWISAKLLPPFSSAVWKESDDDAAAADPDEDEFLAHGASLA